MKKICILLALFMSVSLSSQEIENDDFDDLFTTPEEDAILLETEDETVVDIVEASELFSVNGSFGGTAGMGIGFQEPQLGFEKGNSDFILGATANADVTFVARPDKTVKIVASLDGGIDDENIGNPWSDIDISELYLEYNLLDTAFISFGKLTSNVGSDFIDIEDGTSILIRLPTILSGLNFYANADSTTIVNKAFDYKKLFIGTSVDYVIDSTRLTAGFQYKKLNDKKYEERFGTLLGVKSTLWNVNVFSEVQYFAYPEHFLLGNAGLYFVGKNLYAGTQYNVEGYVTGYEYFNHSVELAFRLPSIFGTQLHFDFISKLQIDNLSGFVIPALSMSPFKYVKVSFALPYIFGNEGFAVYDNFLDGEYSVNLPTELSVLVSLSVDVPF